MSFLVQKDQPQLGVLSQIEIPDSAPGASNFAKVPVFVEIHVGQLGATSTSFTAFIADTKYQINAVRASFGTASTSGTLNVEVAASGTAVGSGTAVLSATIALSGTANTPATGTLATNINSLQLAKGSMLNVLLAGTLTGLANANVSISLIRV